MTSRGILKTYYLTELPVLTSFIYNFFVDISNNFIVREKIDKGTILRVILIKGFLTMIWTLIYNAILQILKEIYLVLLRF